MDLGSHADLGAHVAAEPEKKTTHNAGAGGNPGGLEMVQVG